MGRNNGKLIPFLKEALHMNKYTNLSYEPKGVFSIELPRYEENIDPAYEAILIDWYKVNGRIKKYQNYSVGKAVFQAALHKSLYLISLPKNGKKLRFRLSVSSEIEEKRASQKKKNAVPEVNSPSVSPSYHSDSDNNIHLLENLPDFLDESFKDGGVLSPIQVNASLTDIDNSANIQLNFISECKQSMETVLPKFETMPEIKSIEVKDEAKEVKNAVPQFSPPSVSSSGYHSDGDNLDSQFNLPSVSSSGYHSDGDNLDSQFNLPSVSSSGYHSDGDNLDFLDNWPNLEKCFQEDDVVAPTQENLTNTDNSSKTQLDSVSDCTQSMESVLPNAEGILDIKAMEGLPGFESFQELMDCSNIELSQFLGNLDLPVANDAQNLSVTGNQPALQELELKQHTPAVNHAQNFWVCKSKIQIGSLLQLVCELEVPELGIDEKGPDVINFGGMLEAGKTYNLKKKMRVDSYLLLMLTPA